MAIQTLIILSLLSLNFNGPLLAHAMSCSCSGYVDKPRTDVYFFPNGGDFQFTNPGVQLPSSNFPFGFGLPGPQLPSNNIDLTFGPGVSGGNSQNVIYLNGQYPTGNLGYPSGNSSTIVFGQTQQPSLFLPGQTLLPGSQLFPGQGSQQNVQIQFPQNQQPLVNPNGGSFPGGSLDITLLPGGGGVSQFPSAGVVGQFPSINGVVQIPSTSGVSQFPSTGGIYDVQVIPGQTTYPSGGVLDIQVTNPNQPNYTVVGPTVVGQTVVGPTVSGGSLSANSVSHSFTAHHTSHSMSYEGSSQSATIDPFGRVTVGPTYTFGNGGSQISLGKPGVTTVPGGSLDITVTPGQTVQTQGPSITIDGQFPQGQFPQGLFPQGQFPQGQFPQGLFPQGQFPQGQLPQGLFPQGQFPQGQLPQVLFPQGQFPQGLFPQGQLPQGQFPQGNLVSPGGSSQIYYFGNGAGGNLNNVFGSGSVSYPSSAIFVLPQTCPPGWTYFYNRGNGLCYRAHHAIMTYPEASGFCKRYNATVAAPRDKDQQIQIMRTYYKGAPANTTFWIGIKLRNHVWTAPCQSMPCAKANNWRPAGFSTLIFNKWANPVTSNVKRSCVTIVNAGGRWVPQDCGMKGMQEQGVVCQRFAGQ